MTLFLFFVLSFLTLFSIRYDPEVMKIDKGYYQDYTQSIIEDGDFNITNQVDPKFNWIVTKTYNHPDFHDHGISVLWSPFFLYGKALQLLGFNLDVLESKKFNTAQIIAGYFFGFLTILLTLKLLMMFWPRFSGGKEVIAGLALSTPFFWHLIFHPANSDITVTIYPVISLFLFFYLMKDPEPKLWGAYGLWMGYSVIGKITMGFYYLLPLYGLILLIKSEGRRHFLKCLLCFSMGTILLQSAFLLNEWIKFGIPINGYLATVNSSYYLLFETFFGPIGYFYISPVYFLAVPVIFLLVKSKESNWKLAFILLSIPISKMIIESFTFAVVGDLGARHYIIDFVVFAIFIGYLRLKQKIAFRILMSLCVLWMGLMCVWFSYNISLTPFVWGQDYLRELSFVGTEMPKMFYRINIFRDLSVIDVLISLSYYYPLILISSFILILTYKVKKIPSRLMWGMAIGCSFVYLLFTGLNFVNNETNVVVQKKQGLYEKSVVGSGMSIYLYDENVGALVDTVNFFKFRGNFEFSAGAQQVLDKYLIDVRQEILVDPIGLKKTLESGGMREPFN